MKGTIGRRRARSRHERTMNALTAAGVNVVETYERTQGSAAQAFWINAARQAGFTEVLNDWWPTEAQLDISIPALYREGNSAVYRMPDDSLVVINVSHGEATLSVAAPSRRNALEMLSHFRSAYPAAFIIEDGGETKIPITFWSLGPFGPSRRMRRIDVATWNDIAANYTATVRDELAELMLEFLPGKSGQLLLWQGPPGTGKTWALRALASEWSSWAEFHYITDPDAFFVDSAIYMVDVLLADSYSAVDAAGEVYDEQADDGKWRVLVLEDTGELLSANAKEKYGQGLSRLLNVVDGMIGQGLRVLVIVTTNDELGDLNPAVLRPGRCASQIVFAPLTPEEIAEWGADDADPRTIAELYAGRGKDALAEDTDVVAEIVSVIESHMDDMTGYGETAYNADTRTVLYVSGDWTDTDPIDADLLAIDGVDTVEHEAEGLPDDWWDADVIYPENPPKWVTVRAEHTVSGDVELDKLVAFADQPLDRDADLEGMIAAAILEQTKPHEDSRPILERALAMIGEAHATTAAVVQDLVAHTAALTASSSADALTLATLDVLREAVNRPAAPAPDVHVHMPEQDLNVTVAAAPTPDVVVNIPEQRVEFTAPDVHVHVPEQAAPVVHVEAPHVEVAVPEPSPVHVHVPAAEPSPVHVTFEQPRSRGVRVRTDPRTGEKTYVPVED